jgi:uncharacterized protein (DUF58 family)
MKWRPQHQGPIYRFLRHVFTQRLTDSGRVMFWVGVIAMGAGGATMVVHVYVVFCVVASLFGLSMVLARLARVPLGVDAPVPSRTTCGVRLQLPIAVRNDSKRRAMDLRFAEYRLPRAILSHPEDGGALDVLAPGERSSVARALEFTRRGHYVLEGVQQQTLFPWGLWRDIVPHPQARSVLVYPRFHPLTSLDIPVGKRYQPGGIALSSHLGDSIEFIGTREFRVGDPVRAIHHKTWARIGQPAVKEFQEEYFCRVALLLDTFIQPGSEKKARAAFEAAVSMSAAIADSLSREEYIIDLFAAGPEIYTLQSGRSLAYLENVLDILACLEPCSEPPFEKITPILLENLATITTTIVVMLDWDAHRENMVRLIRDNGSAVKFILVRDGPSTADYASADALTGGVVHLTSQDEAAGVEAL